MSKITWSGNLEAQREADEAYAKLKPKGKKRKKQEQKRKLRELRRQKQRAIRCKPRKKIHASTSRTRTRRERYDQYIRSTKWKTLRKQALKLAGGKCFRCGRQDNLHVHHLTYARFANELLSDLIVLCETCHDKQHNNS